MFQRITTNLVGARKRYETLEGKRYLVVPTVALTVGVHNGSQGPLYYPAEELSKNPLSWNHKPIVTPDHPTMNGDGVSACDPGVVEKQCVGLIFNASYDGRLRWDSWLDEDKLSRVSAKVLNSLNNGEMVEVSTGLFHDREETAGEYNGEKYIGIVRNIQPDHLAILPDTKGACSIDKGAGLLRNNHEMPHHEVSEHLTGQLRDKSGDKDSYDSPYIHSVMPKHVIYSHKGKDFRHGYKVQDGKATLHGEPEEVRKSTTYQCANGEMITVNEEHQGPLKFPQPSEEQLSDPMRRQQAQKVLTEKYSGVMQEGDWGGWVTDIFANFVIYSKDGKHFRLPYTYDDDMIRFDGEPEEVERVSEYRSKRKEPIDGTSSPYNVNHQETDMAKATIQNAIHASASAMADSESKKGDSQTRTPSEARKKEVNSLVSGGHWGEEYRTWLEGMDDGPFEKIKSYVTKGATDAVVSYGYEGIGDRSNVHTANKGQQMTTDQYVANAPSEVREMLQNALATQADIKRRLVAGIIANKANQFTKEWLMTQSVPMLRGLASLAGQQSPTTNYGGQADVPAMFITGNQQTNNQEEEEEVLPLPVMSW